MPDYIPASDLEFDPWLSNLIAYMSANREQLGLNEVEITSLSTSYQQWQTAFADFKATQTAAEVAHTLELCPWK